MSAIERFHCIHRRDQIKKIKRRPKSRKLYSAWLLVDSSNFGIVYSCSRNTIYFFLVSDDPCQCSAEYNITLPRNGTQVKVEAYCNQWNSDANQDFYCYLGGGLTANKCPGAKKSGKGDFYWTKDPAVCIGAENKEAKRESLNDNVISRSVFINVKILCFVCTCLVCYST